MMRVFAGRFKTASNFSVGFVFGMTLRYQQGQTASMEDSLSTLSPGELAKIFRATRLTRPNPANPNPVQPPIPPATDTPRD